MEFRDFLFRPITCLLEKMLMKDEELSAKLTTLIAKAEKVGTEIKALQGSILGRTDVPQDIVDKVNALDLALTADDNLNPDAAPPAS